MVRRLGFLAVTLALLTVACGDTSGTTTPKGAGSAGDSASGGMGSGTLIDVTIDPPTLTQSFRAAGQSVNPPKLKLDISLSHPITQSVVVDACIIPA